MILLLVSCNTRKPNDDVIIYQKELQPSIKDTNHLNLTKIEFDTILSKSNSSIGWIELGQVRNELSQKFDLTKNEFYELVEQLVNAYHNEYELSTGGNEGVILRGLLHGYVRGI